MARRRRRIPPTPLPLSDALCALLPFATPAVWLTEQLLRRAHAAEHDRTQLTAAEVAALDRLYHVLDLISDLELAVDLSGRQAIASRVLAYTPGDIVIALLWRDPQAHSHPYAVQIARDTAGTTTLLAPHTDLRVDQAWPRYRAQTWPPAEPET